MNVLKRLLTFMAIGVLVGAFALPAGAAVTNTVSGKPNHNWWKGGRGDTGWLFLKEIQTIIEDTTLESGYMTFTNGLIIDNETDTVLTITEDNGAADEDLLFTFTANTLTLTSATGMVLWDFALVVPKSDQFLFDPVADPVGSVEGTVYYDSDDDNLYVRTTAGLVDLTASAASGTLDAAYDSGGSGAGAKINADTGGVEIEVADNKVASTEALLLDYNDVTNNAVALRITNAGAGNSIDIEGTSGNDIEGTGDLWTASVTGVLTAVSGDFTGAAGITLSNDGTITNTTDAMFTFTDGGEDISFYLNGDVLTWSSTTDVAAMNFAEVHDLYGIKSIGMDAAVGTSITLTSTGDAQDLTIEVTQATNSSLILKSSGTAADAFQIITSAGGIDITNGGAAGGEDIDIDAVLASLNINADEDVADALTFTASAGGIDITADGASGKDLDLVCTSGSTNISGGEANAAAVTIAAGAGGMTLDTASSYDIAATATGGKILFVANENAIGVISLATTGGGGTTESITILNDQGDGAASISIASTAGGITMLTPTGKALLATGTAGSNTTLGNSTGDFTVAGDDIDFTVTAATDDVFQILSSASSQVFCDIDLGATDAITWGDNSNAGATTVVGATFTVTGGIGGTSGAGGATTVQGGTGGIAIAATSAGGAGGALTLSGGIGGAGLTDNAGGAGGALTMAGGIGGVAHGTGHAAGGGNASLTAGAGGVGVVGGGNPGAAGTVAVTAGAGGGGTTADNGAAGGTAGLVGGVGGIGAATKIGGAGGAVSVTGGLGGASLTGTSGAGGQVNITGGAEGSPATGTGDVGGAVNIDGGAGVTGGAVSIDAGAGSTTDGSITIGATDALALTMGNATCVVILTGSSIDLSTDKLENFTVETTTDIDDRAMADTESGGYFNNIGDTNTTVFTLPAAAAGLIYTFTDVMSGAGIDLIILAGGGDKINSGTAAEYYNCYDDAVGSCVTLLAISADDWIVVSEKGTWVNDDDALDN